MISLAQSVAMNDELVSLKDELLSAYLRAIEICAEAAVSTEGEAVEQHREALRKLSVELDGRPVSRVVRASSPALEHELRTHATHVSGFIVNLREEVLKMEALLQEVMSSMSTHGESSEKLLRQEVRNLQGLTRLHDLPALHTELRKSIKSLERSVEQIRSEHSVTISQFRDEMRTLQKRLEAAESASALDPVTFMLNRQQIETRIQQRANLEQPFCVIFVCVRNLSAVQQAQGRAAADEVTIALSRRLAPLLPAGSHLGRRGDSDFLVLMEGVKADALKLTRDLVPSLERPYPAAGENTCPGTALKVAVGFVEWKTHDTGDTLLARVETLMRAIAARTSGEPAPELPVSPELRGR